MMHERDSDGAEVPDAKRSRVHVENGAPDGIDPIGQPVLEEAAVPVQTEFSEGDLPAVPSSLTGSSNLFISTIPHDYTEHSLTAMFAPYGDIDSVRVMRDSATGSSRGFGFVKFRTHEMAQDAINVLNGRRLNNRPLTVKLAEMPASSNPLKMALGSSAKNENIYIKNLPPSINDEQLKLVFQSCGRILSTRVLFDKMTGQPRGAAMLRYESIDAADRAIQELSGQVFPGGTERMVIKYADSEQEKEKKKARRVASMTAPSPGMSKPPPAVIPPVRATPVISPKPLPVVIPPPHKLQQMQQMQQPQQSYLQPATAQYQLPAQPAGVQQPYYTSDAMFYQEPTPPPPQLDMGLQYGQPQTQYAQAQPQYTQPQPQYGGVPQYGAPQQMQYGGGYGGQQPAPPPPPPQQQQYMQPMQPIQQIQSPLQQPQMPQQNQNADMTNLYIANLPQEADDALLTRLFSPFGPITSVRAMIDVVTGQCKGIGFVRFGNWQSASNAARMMNGSQIGSKTISVSFKK